MVASRYISETHADTMLAMKRCTKNVNAIKKHDGLTDEDMEKFKALCDSFHGDLKTIKLKITSMKKIIQAI